MTQPFFVVAFFFAAKLNIELRDKVEIHGKYLRQHKKYYLQPDGYLL